MATTRQTSKSRSGSGQGGGRTTTARSRSTASGTRSGGRSTSGKRRTTTAKSRSTSSGKRRTTAAKGRGGSGQARPVRREVWGTICLLLAFFGAIGYFGVDALFIAWFRNLLTGLFGYGYYLAAPVLLLCSYILMFHKGRPVRLRVGCALALPMVWGAVLHLFLSQIELERGLDALPQLWTQGQEMAAGGVISGLLGHVLRVVFSQLGATVVLVVAGLCLLLFACNRTVAEVVEHLRERRANRLEYVPEEEEEEEPQPRPAPQPRHTAPRPAPPQRRNSRSVQQYDIPVEGDESGAEEAEGQPAPAAPPEEGEGASPARRKRLFDRVAGKVSPDKVLLEQRMQAQHPHQDAPAEAPQPEVYSPLEEPVEDSDFRQAAAERPVQQAVPPAPSAAPPVVRPDPGPPVIREPAVAPAPAQEEAEPQGDIAQEIEAGLQQEVQAYRYPPISLLHGGMGGGGEDATAELQANQQRLQDTLDSFGVDAHIVNVTRGPSVTRYELELEQGVKLNKITNLSDDIALSLGASAVRVAPIPNKIATVGIEVPNRQVTPVSIREVLSSSAFTESPSKVSFAVGKDISGNCVVCNIAKLPHMLIAGTTGSGKSVCTNSLIVSLLYKATPEEVRLIMVDPKMVELGMYNGIPHLLIPVVTDPKKAAGALQWAVNEMMKRYRAFSEVGAKDLASYNNHARRAGKETMPQIVVVIDELADLMLVAAKEVEESICRVAQMGRASGMHLVIATQRPSADVITGLMKANIPSRIAFAVASSLESRIILDNTGAEKLVGKGDMLYAPLGEGKPQRVQGCFISEEEVAEVVGFIKERAVPCYDEAVMHEIERHAEEKNGKAPAAEGGAQGNDYDELLPAAIDVVLEMGQASVSMLQRRLKLGYGRAARLVDQMEEKGVVGPFEGSKPRQLLITKAQWLEMQNRQDLTPGVPPAAAPEGAGLAGYGEHTPPAPAVPPVPPVQETTAAPWASAPEEYPVRQAGSPVEGEGHAAAVSREEHKPARSFDMER